MSKQRENLSGLYTFSSVLGSFFWYKEVQVMIETLLTIILLPVAAVAFVVTVCLAIGLIDGFKK